MLIERSVPRNREFSAEPIRRAHLGKEPKRHASERISQREELQLAGLQEGSVTVNGSTKHWQEAKPCQKLWAISRTVVGRSLRIPGSRNRFSPGRDKRQDSRRGT